MSYHDSHMKPGAQSFGDRSKKNYYDELSFWVSRAKNLETLLIEATEHIVDFRDVMLAIRKSGAEGDNFDEEHLEGLEKFLRVAVQEIGEKKEEETD